MVIVNTMVGKVFIYTTERIGIDDMWNARDGGGRGACRNTPPSSREGRGRNYIAYYMQ